MWATLTEFGPVHLGVPGADHVWHLDNIFVFSLVFAWFGFVLT